MIPAFQKLSVAPYFGTVGVGPLHSSVYICHSSTFKKHSRSK